jgi:ATP-dependent Clp protease protease subunit
MNHYNKVWMGKSKKDDEEEGPKKCTVSVDKQKRFIYLFDAIKEESCLEVVKGLIDLDMEMLRKKPKNKQQITLVINSPGGYCCDGFAIIDTMLKISCPISSIAVGEICSMAPLIYVCADVRFITPNTWVMLHPISTGTNDYIEFAKSRIENSEKTEAMYDKLFLERTKIPPDIYYKAKQKELWLSAEESIKYGIATKML